jgi:Zn-dependent protease/predicted transcriptional regulator
MKGSFRLIKAFGIPIQIHWTFPLLIVWILFTGQEQYGDWNGLVWTLLTVAALFTCVVLHELGHALTARKYGVDTQDIILSPIGGVARLDSLPEKPIQEFWVAIAGPLVNVAIILLLLPVLWLFPDMWAALEGAADPESNYVNEQLFRRELFVPILVLLNGMLVLFNLLPAFPMDGGRVLRALLATRMSRLKATRIASRVGQGLAIVFFAISVWQFNLLLGFIGLFVFFAATNEYRYVRTTHLLKSFTIGQLLPEHQATLSPGDNLHEVVDLMQRSNQRNFAVLDEWNSMQGIVKEERVLDTIKQNGLSPHQVREVMESPSAVVSSDYSLEEAFGLLASKEAIIAVTDGGKVLGVVDYAMLDDFMRLQEKLKR